MKSHFKKSSRYSSSSQITDFRIRTAAERACPGRIPYGLHIIDHLVMDTSHKSIRSSGCVGRMPKGPGAAGSSIKSITMNHQVSITILPDGMPRPAIPIISAIIRTGRTPITDGIRSPHISGPILGRRLIPGLGYGRAGASNRS